MIYFKLYYLFTVHFIKFVFREYATYFFYQFRLLHIVQHHAIDGIRDILYFLEAIKHKIENIFLNEFKPLYKMLTFRRVTASQPASNARCPDRNLKINFKVKSKNIFLCRQTQLVKYILRDKAIQPLEYMYLFYLFWNFYL